MSNPRTPAVPATLDLSLSEYFTAAAMMGILASQHTEPDQDWVTDWAFSQGRKAAAKAFQLRRKTRKSRSR